MAVSVAILGLGLLAPVASAKIYFPMRAHVMVVGKGVRLAIPGCDGCIANYPGPVRLYLVRADVAIPMDATETTEPPRPSRPLGRLGDGGRLLLTPRVAGRFRLVALATVGTTELHTMLMPVSPVFVVHPRGWQSAA
jgi:hypothetical protein